MTLEVFNAALEIMERIVRTTRSSYNGQADSRKIKVMFHGGEPLVAGHEFWRQALEELESRFGRGRCQFTVQSNLWLLDEEFCELFIRHRVDLSTSLDGPEEINDAQRGRGYFARTMRGIRLAQSYGLNVGCIATFTPASAPRWREVFDFFLTEQIGFTVHAAVRGLGDKTFNDPLSASEFGALLKEMLTAYIQHRHDMRISLLDQMCQGVAFAEGKVCSFRDCLGMFVVFDPEGGIYPCQRFCGRAEWRLGCVEERPTLELLLSSPVAQRFAQRQEQVRTACGDCRHFPWCKGGCPYNAWADPHGDGIRDPYCEAYRSVFDYIQERLIKEIGSEENRRALEEEPIADGRHPLLRRGPLIELARGGAHPYYIARTARRIVAAVELARGPDLPTVAQRLVKMGIARTQSSAEALLVGLWERLHPSTPTLNNLYLHVTFKCPLRCTHCYAYAGDSETEGAEMPVEAVRRLIHEAWQVGFRQVVITGGEPLVHSRRDELLTMLAEERVWLAQAVRPVNSGCPHERMNLVLRTNLVLPLSAEDLRRIAVAFDQVVVSVDGNEQTHDARRGQGTYQKTVENLERYLSEASHVQGAAELSLAAVLRAKDVQGEPGDAVRELAARLGVRRVRFRPLLPLGRARDWDEPPTSEALGAHLQPMELIENGFHPIASCGFGQNLYVEPSGDSFPCYAYHQQHAYLGNVITQGLKTVINSPPFQDLSRHNVDTNPKCRLCEVRYLCGGACRAWGGEVTQHEIDAPPPECEGLRQRAMQLLATAREYLGVKNS
jgi:uncharacterized protein